MPTGTRGNGKKRKQRTIECTEEELKALRGACMIAWQTYVDRQAATDPTWQAIHDANVIGVEDWLNLCTKLVDK